MRCLGCGCEIEEGKLLCPNCGKEIQIVPDFEPEIEDKINHALEGITTDIRTEDDASGSTKVSGRSKWSKRQITLICSVIAVLFLLAAFAVGIIVFGADDSPEKCLEKAEKYAAQQKYDKAIEQVLRAVDRNSSDLEIRNQLGEYYVLDHQDKNAVTAFEDIISMDGENERAYENLIGIYEAKGDYQAINQLIRSSSSAKIVNTFTRYIANPPEFSYPQGTYEEILPVKLTANTAGTVYYTMDGSTPDIHSEVYKTPIFLDGGIVTIKAIFINEYGIQSEASTCTYQIILNQAHEPEVSLAEGSYTEPQTIAVTVPDGESVYYTVDGTTPTKDSIPYSNPVALPFGDSTYCFISYSQDGDASEVVTKRYRFAFEPFINVQYAVNLLVMGLKNQGILLEVDGTVPGKPGRNIYICSTAITINQKSYYLVVEYYEDPTGTDTKTGNLYCVGTDNGQLYKASLGADGSYSVVSF